MHFVKLSSEELDELFHTVSKRLKSQQTTLDDKALLDVFHRVIDGVEFMSQRYSRWWTVVEDGEIDLAVPSKSPFNLVIERFELTLEPTMWPTDKVAQENGLMAYALDNKSEMQALSAFWNAFILEARQDPVLKLAS